MGKTQEIESLMSSSCDVEHCTVPRPHEHTGVFHDSYLTEYFCPSGQDWTLCPGPCPDGTLHSEKRTIPTHSEVIKLLPNRKE